MIEIIQPLLTTKYLTIIISTLIIFILLLETRNCLRNIWWRITEDGNKRFNIGGIINMFKAPFIMPLLWKPQYLDINPYAIIGMVTIFYLTYFNCNINFY